MKLDTLNGPWADDTIVGITGRRWRMDLERARRLMAEHSLDIIDERPVAHGTQLITAQGAILTIYDSGNRPDEKLLRARQNVVLELGMMLALLGRRRVAILLPSSANMERPSDIHGLIYIPYKDNVTEAGLTLAKEIDAQGIHINSKV